MTRMRRAWLLSLSVAVTVGLAGCSATASDPAPLSAGPALALNVPDLELRASLLLLADRLLYEPFTVGQALQAWTETRRLLALTLGRLQDDRGLDALEELLLDPEPEVRRAAVFALGRLPSRRSQSALLRALTDTDTQTAARSAGSLARLGVPLAEVAERLSTLDPEEATARLAPDLYLYASNSPVDEALRRAIAQRALFSSDAWLRGRAVYSLNLRPSAVDRELLLGLLDDPEARVRLLAARGLGAVGLAGDLERLRASAANSDSGVAVAALLAGKRIVDRGEAAAPLAWHGLLLDLMADRRTPVRLAAVRSMASWLLDDELGSALERLAAAGDIAERCAALAALVEGGDPRAASALSRGAIDPSPFVRLTAARAGPRWLPSELAVALQADTVPAVRQALSEARLREDAGDLQALETLLSDVDGGVRAAGLRWLVRYPVMPVETVAAALSGPGRGILDLSLLAVDSLVARARVEPGERGTIVAVLERLSVARDYLVRRRAIEGLIALEREAPPVGQVSTRREIAVYREIVLRTDGRPRVEVETSRGSFTIEFDCPTSPLSCLHFLELAGQGFYRGLPFYAVSVSEVESGDPRSDGWGGPGFRVRDEASGSRFLAGSLSLVRLVPHTAGSRFFITLEEQPGREGDFTPLGRVVKGLEVLSEIRVGDVVVAMRVVY